MNRFAAAALLGGFLLAGCAVEPETACLAPDRITAHLQDKYGETAIWVGRTEEGITVLYLAPTGTWSVVTFTEEAACIDRAGNGFDFRRPAA